MLNLPTITFGDATDALAKWRDGIQRIRGIKGDGSILVKNDSGGTIISANLPERKDLLLSGSTSPYTASEVMPTASGTWSPISGAISGVYEFNGLAGLGGKVVPAERVFGDSWRFNFIRYGGVPTGGTLIGCGCTVPFNQTMTTTSTDAGILAWLPSDTYTYQPNPSGYSAWDIFSQGAFSGHTTSPIWHIWSNEFTNGHGNASRNLIYCTSGSFAFLNTENESLLGWSTYNSLVTYGNGIHGNTCTPWYMAWGFFSSSITGVGSGLGVTLTATP